jgi:hypothetical protein
MVRSGIHGKSTAGVLIALALASSLTAQTTSVSIRVNGAPVSATNPLPITGGTGGGGGGASATDRSSFTAGASSLAPAGGVWNDALADLTAGMFGVVRLTKQRAFHVNLRDSSGAEISPATEGGNLATIATNTGRIPTSPAQDRTTAAAPAAVRLSDGSAFLDPRDVSDRAARLLGHTVTDSGSVTSATIATDSVGLAKDTTLTGGGQKAIARGGAKGTTTAADLTGENVDANTQALHVFVKNSSLPVTGTFWQTTQPVSGTFWPTAAASPSASRLSDGSAFYDATKTGQLPAALDGSGFLKIHEQGTAATNQTQINGTAVSAGNGIADAGTQRVAIAQELTYSAGTTAATATAAGTGVFFSLCGSASKTVQVQRLSISGTVATGAKNGDVIVSRTSAATSGGTATTLTAGPFDSNAAAATAVAKFYTVLATAGTLAAVVDTGELYLPLTGTGTSSTPLWWRWRDTDSQSPTLRGTAQCLEAKFGTTTTNAPTLAVSVVWTEK